MNRDVHITYAQRMVLVRLARHGTQLERDLVSRKLSAALVERGWIERHLQPRVATTISLTEVGRALVRPEDECECRACRRAAQNDPSVR